MTYEKEAGVSESGVTLFGFEGAGKRTPRTERKEPGELTAREEFVKAFFAYFLSRKKVCTFSSVGRATDS